MTIKEIIEKSTQHFRQKGFATARLDAELLFGHALNMNRTELYIHFEKPLLEGEIEKCREVVRRRSAGEPVAYICGKKDFYKSSFHVGPGVLIPRPDTEALVEAAIDWIDKNHSDGYLRILDLGAGTGCISLSLAKEYPQAEIVAVEKSQTAAEFFKKNKIHLEVANKVELWVSDVSEIDTGANVFDLVVANPPYISETDVEVDPNVKKYEPHEALFSTDNGLKDIMDWSKVAALVLKAKGLCLFEIGSKQGADAESIFRQHKVFAEIKTLKDYSQRDRVLFAKIN